MLYEQFLLPRAYKNFIVSEDGMIRLRLYNRIVICVPNIKVGNRRENLSGGDLWRRMLKHSVRLLNPLSIPANPWEAVGIDFVGPLLLWFTWFRAAMTTPLRM